MALELIEALKTAYNNGEIRPTGKLTNRTQSFDSQLTLSSIRVSTPRAQ